MVDLVVLEVEEVEALEEEEEATQHLLHLQEDPTHLLTTLDLLDLVETLDLVAPQLTLDTVLLVVVLSADMEVEGAMQEILTFLMLTMKTLLKF